MRAFVTLASIFVLSAPGLVQAAGPFGLGAVIGSPTAVTGKYWLDQRKALDGGLGLWFGESVLVYGDYLYHVPGAFGNKTPFAAGLTPYFGVGALVAVSSSERWKDDRYLGRRNGTFGMAVRVPLGIEWRPKDPPLGVFLELVPGIAFIPETGGFLQGGIGIRYYF
jgi:hypothetical protein